MALRHAASAQRTRTAPSRTLGHFGRKGAHSGSRRSEPTPDELDSRLAGRGRSAYRRLSSTGAAAAHATRGQARETRAEEQQGPGLGRLDVQRRVGVDLESVGRVVNHETAGDGCERSMARGHAWQRAELAGSEGSVGRSTTDRGGGHKAARRLIACTHSATATTAAARSTAPATTAAARTAASDGGRVGGRAVAARRGDRAVAALGGRSRAQIDGAQRRVDTRLGQPARRRGRPRAPSRQLPPATRSSGRPPELAGRRR